MSRRQRGFANFRQVFGFDLSPPDGGAAITRPDWFGSFNRHLSDQPSPREKAEVDAPRVPSVFENNRFELAGGVPDKHASFLVTAVRRDAYAKAHPLHVERGKGACRRADEHGARASICESCEPAGSWVPK